MESNLKVKLIAHTPDAEKIIATAAKLCYSSSDIETLAEKQTDEVVERFIKKLTSMGHESPVEHVSFTFAIEGVSRSLTHQLVRHRIASYSQQSQRYVKLNQFEYIVPPNIAKDKKLKDIFISSMERSQRDYDMLVFGLKENHKLALLKELSPEELSQPLSEATVDKIISQAEKMAIEDARYVFPNACESKIIVTMNARTLFNFFNHRCCNRAQWEIRELAKEMLLQCKEVAPTVFSKCGPKCVYDKCHEGSMCCGKQDIMKKIYSGVK